MDPCMRHSVHSIFFDQADAHEAAERWHKALELLYQVHRWAAEDPALWRRMGLLSFLMADREWLERAALEGTHVGDMGAINADLYLARAAELAPADPRGPFWRGWVRHQLYQDPAGAKAHLAEAVRRDPAWPYAHAALARVEVAEAEAGYALRALAHVEAALARLPESARFHYDMGACLAGLGEDDAAREAFERALAMPALPVSAGTEGRVLAASFHGDGEALRPLVTRLYAGILGPTP